MSSVDVLNLVLQELAPELNETFTKWHPFLDRVAGPKKQLKKAKGRYHEFKVITSGPGAATQISTGTEQFGTGRTQNTVKGNAFGTRFIYHFAIPGLDLAETAGNPDMIKSLVKEYPEQGLAHLKELVVAQMVRGAGSSGSLTAAAGLAGLCTLNGQQDYTPAGTALDGVFMPAAPASQTQTVFGIPMQGAAASPTTGWAHQYQDINSFAVDGREKLRLARNTANKQGGSASGIVDLMLGDAASFANYESDLDAHVETASVKDDHVPAKIRSGIKFGDADFFDEDAIDLTDTTSFTTATTRNGVIYGLNMSQWDGFRFGDDEKMETKGFFSFRNGTRIPDMDAWRFEIVNHFQIFCTQLRNQFLVTGGALE